MKKKHTIILCDDDEFILHMYEYRLKSSGFVVHTATTGAEAIEKVTKHTPDLLVLDLIMPDISGFDVIKQLQASANPVLQKLPIVVSSNLAQEKDIKEVLALGAKDFFVKSQSDPKDLVTMIEKYL